MRIAEKPSIKLEFTFVVAEYRSDTGLYNTDTTQATQLLSYFLLCG